MDITASLVKELRDKTGVGMMDCKKALSETGGKFEEAIQYLREKGLSAAAKKSDRETREGKIITAVSPDGTAGAIVEANCETDFVANNESFLAFGATVATAVLTQLIETVDALASATIDGRHLKDVVSEAVLKLGENIGVKRVERIVGQSIGQYVHTNGKIGVIVAFDGVVPAEIAKDVAMHIAASAPTYIRRDEVAASDLEKEAEIIKAQAKNEGKPDAIIEKLVSGKIGKFYKDVCLLEQEFVKDPSKTVGSILPEGRTVTRFVRLSLI